MRKGLLMLAGASLLLGGCAASPKETVLDLDTTDRKWVSARCVSARKAVARYDDQRMTHRIVRTVGNLAAPFAGTATSMAMNAAKDDDRAALNHRVRSACISDPLKGKPAKAGKKTYARR